MDKGHACFIGAPASGSHRFTRPTLAAQSSALMSASCVQACGHTEDWNQRNNSPPHPSTKPPKPSWKETRTLLMSLDLTSLSHKKEEGCFPKAHLFYLFSDYLVYFFPSLTFFAWEDWCRMLFCLCSTSRCQEGSRHSVGMATLFWNGPRASWSKLARSRNLTPAPV